MAKSEVKRTSDITIRVGLNDENIPVHIEWAAEDSPEAGEPQACKGMLLSLFDEESKDTLKIDLWTKDMQVVEMDRFFYQTLRAMADTYYRATQNRELATDMQHFVQYFGERTEIVPPQENK